jgi:hypothetical protein
MICGLSELLSRVFGIVIVNAEGKRKITEVGFESGERRISE